jgi:hypothetical protein
MAGEAKANPRTSVERLENFEKAMVRTDSCLVRSPKFRFEFSGGDQCDVWCIEGWYVLQKIAVLREIVKIIV